MSDLLTAKDVEVKVFKKVRFGGYSVPEVEDFLNQVADDLEAYAEQLEEKEERIRELEDRVKKQEAMKEDIKEALIIARQAAKSTEEKAKADTEKIIADAQAEAEKIIAEAEGKVQLRLDEAGRAAGDIVARAKAEATEINQSTEDRRAQADKSLAGIEQELEARRHDAELQAEEIIASARTESRRLMDNARTESHEYNEQIRFLSLKKQQFLKDTMSLLLDFGKAIEEAQQDIDSELKELNAPEDGGEYSENYAEDVPVEE